jgi:hypothetical protein
MPERGQVVGKKIGVQNGLGIPFGYKEAGAQHLCLVSASNARQPVQKIAARSPQENGSRTQAD